MYNYILALFWVVILSLTICPLHGYNNSSSLKNIASTINYQDQATERYLRDLKQFVRSVTKVKYQPDSYWEEVDKLWEAFQTRQENLKGQFSESQWARIRKLERKYNSLKSKRTKRT